MQCCLFWRPASPTGEVAVLQAALAARAQEAEALRADFEKKLRDEVRAGCGDEWALTALGIAPSEDATPSGSSGARLVHGMLHGPTTVVSRLRGDSSSKFFRASSQIR